jgi:hypothetical protein
MISPVKRHVHYEAAFEDYLQAQGVPYVAVDEARRAAFRDVRLKSFDFIVYSRGPANWLVDIKGRSHSPGRDGRRPGWVNWATLDDLDGLEQWETVFGLGFRGLLVFAYLIDAAADPPAEIVHRFRDERYVFAGVPLDLYRENAIVRSPKWGTVNMRRADFATHVRPLVQLL